MLTYYCSCQLSAQTPQAFRVNERIRFEQFGEDQGINNNIACIFEDRTGYLWFGIGSEGLYRYDGYEFRHLEFIPEDTTSLPHNIVAKIIHEDQDGNIWLISGGMLTRYNRATDDFSRIVQWSDADTFNTWGYIGLMVEDPDGNLWLGSGASAEDPHSGGLVRVERGSGNIQYFKHDPDDSNSLAGNSVTELFADSHGNLWAAICGYGIDRFIPEGPGFSGEFLHHREISLDNDSRGGCMITKIIEDKVDNVWFATSYDGVLRYVREEDRFEELRIGTDPEGLMNQITDLALDQPGNVWIGTRQGLAVFQQKDQRIHVLKNNNSLESRVPAGSVQSVTTGLDGSMWVVMEVGVNENRLFRYDPILKAFETINVREDDPIAPSSCQINQILVDRTGILWIATANDGIKKYDPNKQKFNALLTRNQQQDGIRPESVKALLVDRQNRLWIATMGQGLYCFDRQRQSVVAHFTYDPDHPEGLGSNELWALTEDPPGILWIGGTAGLNRLDTRTMEIKFFRNELQPVRYFGPNYIRALCPGEGPLLWIATMGGGLVSFNRETATYSSHNRSTEDSMGVNPNAGLMSVNLDDRGSVWVGSTGGLHRYRPEPHGQEAQHTGYWHDPTDLSTIGSNMVGKVVFDKQGNTWVITSGGGLNKLNVETGKFKRYTTRTGLLSNTITDVVADDNGYFWLGSFSGLGRFDPETGICTAYDKSDGLLSMEITQGSMHLTREGEILFAGPGGVSYFHPDSLQFNEHVPEVVITRMTVFNKPLVPATGKVTELKHDENFITYEFAALNYTNSHKNQYRYRMIGMDPDTVEAGTSRTASYTGLKPGRYTFWVTGSNNDGAWNPVGTSLDIYIHPPWSRTDLAIGLYVLLFVLAVLGIIRWRTWKLLNDRRILEREVKERTRLIEEKDRHILEMDRMKTRFFANVSHEFRTPLTLIISPLDEIIARMKPDSPDMERLGIIKRSAQKLLNLVNQLLDLSKLDSGKLKLELMEADVIHLLKLICASFLSLAEKNRIRYQFHLPQREHISNFDAGKLEIILNNLLSNAFKYTPEGGIIECYVSVEPVAEAGSPEYLAISVIDSGPGIDPRKKELIFDRFYQGDEQEHMEGGGTGIGLSLTKELVELIHGEISVNSERGEGSCFTVRIPLGMEHLKKSEFIIKSEKVDLPIEVPGILSSVASVEQDSPSGGIVHKNVVHLLVVEDNTDLRSYLKEKLQDEFSITEAVNGEDGLKKALHSIPDLVITDVMMPVMDGIELCRRMKTNERTSHIPVIMLTARADFDSRITGLETGADDYILKPFQIKEVRTRAHNLISQRDHLRQKFADTSDPMNSNLIRNSYDLQFMRRVTRVVEDHLSDFEFDVGKLQGKTGLSQTQLYRKLHALTGYSPTRFIRHLRLKRAARLIEEQKGSITHVAFEVGFGNLSYFTRCFREEFGISPSEYSSQKG